MDTRYTTTQQVVKLIGSHTISKVTVKIGDLKRTKMVRTINLYYNNRTVQAIVELKNKYGLCRCSRVQLCPAGSDRHTQRLCPLSHDIGTAVKLLTAKRGQERFLSACPGRGIEEGLQDLLPCANLVHWKVVGIWGKAAVNLFTESISLYFLHCVFFHYCMRLPSLPIPRMS